MYDKKKLLCHLENIPFLSMSMDIHLHPSTYPHVSQDYQIKRAKNIHPAAVQLVSRYKNIFLNLNVATSFVNEMQIIFKVF